MDFALLGRNGIQASGTVNRFPGMGPLVEGFTTAGVDVGTRSVKVLLLAHGATEARSLASAIIRVEGRRDIRDALAAVRQAWVLVLGASGLSPSDVALVASTGTCDHVSLRVGHFYKQLSQTVGARYLFPETEAVLDIGASQTRCVVVGADDRIRRYRLSNRHASCGGELLDRMTQRLGLTGGDARTEPALWPLQEALAAQAVTILRTARAKGPAVLTGGMVLDASFVSTLISRIADSCLHIQLLVRQEGLYAGAYGAALLAARRYRRLSERLRPIRAVASLPLFQMKRGLPN